jgi:hypothetical protein
MPLNFAKASLCGAVYTYLYGNPSYVQRHRGLYSYARSCEPTDRFTGWTLLHAELVTVLCFVAIGFVTRVKHAMRGEEAVRLKTRSQALGAPRTEDGGVGLKNNSV